MDIFCIVKISRMKWQIQKRKTTSILCYIFERIFVNLSCEDNQWQEIYVNVLKDDFDCLTQNGTMDMRWQSHEGNFIVTAKNLGNFLS